MPNWMFYSSARIVQLGLSCINGIIVHELITPYYDANYVTLNLITMV